MSWPVYLASLIGSWKALATVSPGAEVLAGPGWVVAAFPEQPILDNALVLEPDGLATLPDCYRGRPWTAWTANERCATVLRAAGFTEDTRTWPMTLRLADLTDDLTDEQADDGSRDRLLDVKVRPADGRLIAELNGLTGTDATMLDGVPGLRAYATADGSSGAVLIPVDTDVNVSFVATRPDARGRGLASEVLRRALLIARRDGFVTSSLQSTAVARGVYGRLGYVEVGCWQEWRAPGS